MNSLWKRWKLLTLSTLVLVVLWLGVSFLAAYKLTRRAKPQADEPVPTLTWGTAQPLTLTTSDPESKKLGAWFIPGKPDRPLCLALHGNGMRRSEFLAQAEIVASTGCGVLMISLRAHGDSDGHSNDMGYSARHDVVAAVEWLETNHPNQPIVIFGQSLGSAAAAFAAGTLGDRVQGYIFDCPYRDLSTAVRHRMTLDFPPILDRLAHLGIVTVSPLVVGDINLIAPIKAMEAIPPGIPVLVLVGGKDKKAPPQEAEEMVDRLGQQARLVVVEVGDHGNLHLVEPPTYRNAITAFCNGIECRRR